MSLINVVFLKSDATISHSWHCPRVFTRGFYRFCLWVWLIVRGLLKSFVRGVYSDTSIASPFKLTKADVLDFISLWRVC